jgi:hypothetical protein
MVFRNLMLWLFVFLLTASPGCVAITKTATSGLADDMASALLEQTDVLLVRDGAPAYLIALDGLIQGNPSSEGLLLSGARLYSSYASAFVMDPIRRVALAAKARNYGERALCLRRAELCRTIVGPYEDFLRELGETHRKDLPVLYGFGSAWASWVQADPGDWNALADLPKLQALMERVIELEEGYADGAAHLYLGVLYTLRPTHLGGRPEVGRDHFERAIELSEGRNLLALVLFASQYARLTFDRPLHDRLLTEALEANPVATDYTLSNTLAQETARELLADADDYF